MFMWIYENCISIKCNQGQSIRKTPHIIQNMKSFKYLQNNNIVGNTIFQPLRYLLSGPLQNIAFVEWVKMKLNGNFALKL